MYGIIASVQSRETDVGRQKDFDAFLLILSTEPVFDTFCDKLRTVRGKPVDMAVEFVHAYTHGIIGNSVPRKKNGAVLTFPLKLLSL